MIVLYFLLGAVFALFVMWLLDCLGVVDFWRVKYGDDGR